MNTMGGKMYREELKEVPHRDKDLVAMGRLTGTVLTSITEGDGFPKEKLTRGEEA
jgi:hypothetical protein